jgi:two-component system OmpR family response regulator
MPRILIADDEPNIREVIAFALERAGHATASARNGAEALQVFRKGGIDLVVLDIGMPEMDGLEVCKQIRKSSDLPILFLSARDEEIDRVLGLEIGGDDYVTKPFSARELVARVNVILKRTRNGTAKVPDRLAHGKVRVDAERHGVWFGDTSVTLTALEFALLSALMVRPEVVFSREQLMASAYDGTFVSDRTIDSHIRNLRAKFAEAGCANVIETIHGVGFRLGSCD